MMHIYEGVEPLILQVRVNGKDGFVILPQGDDGDEMDGICFENWGTLTGFVQALAKATEANPAEIERLDDWAERTQP